MRDPQAPLRILHVFRAPVGGLFRHVLDVVRGQTARGHAVGIVCDSSTGGERALRMLADVEPGLALGLTRIPMPRQLGSGDYRAVRHVAARVAQARPDVVHGHGAKGAAYARLAVRAGGALRVYTPHGGSLLYDPRSAIGFFYLTLEKLLQSRTDLFLFESAFIERLFRMKVGMPQATAIVVPNGVGADEFQEVPLKPDATDILYIGELRDLKGIDLLLDALAALRNENLPLTATIVGEGDARAALMQQTQHLRLEKAVAFRPPMPARAAFALGRIMAVPSRAESFPYIVLEAAAAGKPLLATAVGGIPDMFGPFADSLIVPDDCAALTRALREAVNHPDDALHRAALLRERIRNTFSLDAMVDGGIGAYRTAMAARKAKNR